MTTGSLTKLVFGGVAAGIALSSALVVATLVSTTPRPATVAPAPVAPAPVARIDVKSDRPTLTAASQKVARSGKTDALDFTISILRGSDLEPGDLLAPPAPDVTALAPAADTTTAAIEPETPVAIDAPAVVDQTPAPRTRPAPGTRTVVITRSAPINIIPTPAPNGSRPVTAPADGTTNFSAEPVDTQDALRDRQDLVR